MALRVDERPVLTVIDGGRQDMQRYDVIGRRRELAEVIRNYEVPGGGVGMYVEAIDDYADRLANEFPGTDAVHRSIAQAILVAYMEGWNVGYEDGFHGGKHEGLDVAANIVERSRLALGGLRTYPDHIEAMIRKQQREDADDQAKAHSKQQRDA
jgi:hypothetical protein